MLLQDHHVADAQLKHVSAVNPAHSFPKENVGTLELWDKLDAFKEQPRLLSARTALFSCKHTDTITPPPLTHAVSPRKR